MNKEAEGDTLSLDLNKSGARGATLAELLTHFTLKRPLYIDESSALCYQLLEQLKQHLYQTELENDVHRLLFPTLANIIITEDGIAYTRPSKTGRTESAHDWLSALSQTLRSHTLLATSKESFAFQALLREFSANPLKHSELQEKIPVWLTICLQLCTNESPEQTDLLLRDFQFRSHLSQHSQLIQQEMVAKLVPQTSPTGLGEDEDSIRSASQGRYFQAHRDTQDREAFLQWTQKWHQVNLEYHHKQRTARKNTTTIRPLSIKISDSLPHSEAIGLTSNKRSPPLLSPKYASHTETLKALYTSIVGRPIGLLRKGLKDVREQLKTCNLSKNSPPTKEGHGVSSTVTEDGEKSVTMRKVAVNIQDCTV